MVKIVINDAGKRQFNKNPQACAEQILFLIHDGIEDKFDAFHFIAKMVKDKIMSTPDAKKVIKIISRDKSLNIKPYCNSRIKDLERNQLAYSGFVLNAGSLGAILAAYCQEQEVPLVDEVDDDE